MFRLFFFFCFGECGVKYDRPNARIIGGIDTVEHSWPFAVLIQQRYKKIVALNDELYLVTLYESKFQIKISIFILFRFQHLGCVEEH